MGCLKRNRKLCLRIVATLSTDFKYLVVAMFMATLQMAGVAQSTYELGVLPLVNVNMKFKKEWSLNTKIESRQLFQRGEFNDSKESKYTYVLTDLSFIAAKKISLNGRIAGGYLLRYEDDAFFHRFIQQYVVVQRLSGWRLAHRISSDQTFSSVERPEFRLRYRITSEIPLNGVSVDEGEFYVKINNEYLNSLQANKYDLEIRLVPLLGYDITDNFKLELGLDYRVDSFIYTITEHNYWICFNVFIDIK